MPSLYFAWTRPEIYAPTSVTAITYLLQPKHTNNRNSGRGYSRAL
jgi:hypothetical protein